MILLPGCNQEYESDINLFLESYKADVTNGRTISISRHFEFCEPELEKSNKLQYYFGKGNFRVTNIKLIPPPFPDDFLLGMAGEYNGRAVTYCRNPDYLFEIFAVEKKALPDAVGPVEAKGKGAIRWDGKKFVFIGRKWDD